MKKMKRLVTKPSPRPYDRSFEDPRAVLKHQSLLQDFEELLEETEEKKKQLEMLKEKRIVLLAEVKFLRRRYKYLAEIQSQNLPVNNYVQLQQKPVLVGRSMERQKKSGAAVAASRRQGPRPDSKLKWKIFNGTDLALQAHPSDFNQSQKAMGKEGAARNSSATAELSQSERAIRANDASARKVPQIFDLNEISREEEELQADGNEMMAKEPMFSSLRGSIDEQLNELKVSACRKNAGNGTGRAGKRKISWQDPVASQVGILSPLR